MSEIRFGVGGAGRQAFAAFSSCPFVWKHGQSTPRSAAKPGSSLLSKQWSRKVDAVEAKSGSCKVNSMPRNNASGGSDLVRLCILRTFLWLVGQDEWLHMAHGEEKGKTPSILPHCP